MTLPGARKKAMEARLQVDDGEDPAQEIKAKREAITVAALWEEYDRRHLPRLEESTRRRYRGIARMYILPLLRGKRARDVAVPDVNRLHDSLAEMPRTANQAVAILSSMLAKAEAWGHREPQSNPCGAVERFPENEIERPLTTKEWGTLAAKLRIEEKFAWPFALACIRLLIWTGMRKGEAEGLLDDDANLKIDARQIHLTHHKTKKRKKVKVVFLNDAALAIVQQAQKTKKQLGMESNPYLFPGEGGDNHTGAIRGLWDRIREGTTFADVRIHDLRHSFASEGMGAGLQLDTLAALLGHTNTQMTKRYAHMAQGPGVAFSKIVEDQIKKKMSRQTKLPPAKGVRRKRG